MKSQFSSENQDPDAQQSENSISRLSRRLFLGAGAGATLAALAAPGSALAKSVGKGSIKKATTRTTPTYAGSFVQFKEPQPRLSTGGVVDIGTLRVNTINFNDPQGNAQTVRVYNNAVPGPSIFVNPGDQIKVTLENNLSTADPTCTSSSQPNNFPYCLNTTNLHFHGLHVSPSTKTLADGSTLASDDVLIEVDPGGNTQNYCVQLPTFHAPGTHWYHAHKHGATGVQVSNGMAGAIIVRDPVNGELVPSEDDLVFLIQELATENNIANAGATPLPFYVNGDYQPTLTLSQNQLQRWRFINATSTPRGYMNLKLVKYSDDPNAPPDTTTTGTGVTLNAIAFDGILLYGKPPMQTTSQFFSPGNRVDFLVQLPQAGAYKLVKDTFAGPGGASLSGKNSSKNSNQVLAYVRVQSSKIAAPPLPTLPNNPPDYLKPFTQAEIDQIVAQTVEFSAAGFNSINNKGFQINGQSYSMNRVDFSAALNTVETWKLTNKFTGFDIPHPFHIHVNPFQVVSINGNSQGGPNDLVWWDTFSVPQAQNSSTDGEVIIISRFTDYPGEYVLHCHILIHEDAGMMANVKVTGAGTGPCVPCTGTACTDTSYVVN